MRDVGFRIDPEFSGKIPPIGADEFAQLRENILAAGEVYEPLVVWKEGNTLVDGHNRWKVIQEAQSIKWHVRELHFADKWAAFDWMYKNQLGRRNLTDEQRTYTIGKMNEARKKSVTNETGVNQYTKVDGRQTGTEPNRIAGQIAEELGVGRRTVNRAAAFAKGVDALRKVSPEAAETVLTGKAKVTKSAVAEMARMEQKEVEAAAEAIMTGMAVKPQEPQKRKPGGFTKADRELAEIIKTAMASQTDYDGGPAFGIEELIGEIDANGENYVRGLRSTLAIRTDILKDDDAKQRVFKAIAAIVQEIIKVRSEFVK